jgi:hypothetical protein
MIEMCLQGMIDKIFILKAHLKRYQSMSSFLAFLETITG